MFVPSGLKEVLYVAREASDLFYFIFGDDQLRDSSSQVAMDFEVQCFEPEYQLLVSGPGTQDLIDIICNAGCWQHGLQWEAQSQSRLLGPAHSIISIINHLVSTWAVSQLHTTSRENPNRM